MSILKLKPACKSTIWGGDRLSSEFHIVSDTHPLAEAWVLSCHKDGPSVIENGPWAGTELPKYIEKAGAKVLGNTGAAFKDFPLLIKLIDAKDDLSIQVHPSNEYAMEHEHQYGKTEMWYILDAKPNAFLYCGFKEAITQAEFSAAISQHTLPDHLNAIEVHAGDVIFIPSGTLHAIGKGILLAEIQQNSNVTYRVYDYGRLDVDGNPRTLHIEKALAVTDLRPPRTDYPFGAHLASCDYFTVDRFEGPFSDFCDAESFISLLVLDGEGAIRCGGEQLQIQKGDSLFLPAESGFYEAVGNCTVLRTRAGAV